MLSIYKRVPGKNPNHICIQNIELLYDFRYDILANFWSDISIKPLAWDIGYFAYIIYLNMIINLNTKNSILESGLSIEWIGLNVEVKNGMFCDFIRTQASLRTTSIEFWWKNNHDQEEIFTKTQTTKHYLFLWQIR